MNPHNFFYSRLFKKNNLIKFAPSSTLFLHLTIPCTTSFKSRVVTATVAETGSGNKHKKKARDRNLLDQLFQRRNHHASTYW